MDETNQCVWTCQKLRLKAISFVAEISKNPAPERRSGNRHHTEEPEIHPNISSWIRDKLPNHRRKPRKKASARLVASQPLLGLLQFLRSHQYKTPILYDQRTPD